MSINLKTHNWAKSKNLKSFYFPEITSTNDVAKAEFAGLGENFALYLADHQTKGRGRGEKTWQNMGNGEVLLSTWCFRLDSPPQPHLTPILGLALYESLFVFDSSLPLRLKAPNDLFLDEGKLAGLLVEVNQKGSESLVFVGLGLNALSAPKVDIQTSCLKNHTPQFEEQWSDFCKYLYNQFLLSMDKGIAKQISEDDQDDLLEALNSGVPDSEQYLSVSPHCDLKTAKGTIPWSDL